MFYGRNKSPQNANKSTKTASQMKGSIARIIMRGLYLSALLLTTACTHTPVAVCPAVVEYSEGQQAEAADELLTLPAGSILTQMMVDYGELRARLRTCAP